MTRVRGAGEAGSEPIEIGERVVGGGVGGQKERLHVRASDGQRWRQMALDCSCDAVTRDSGERKDLSCICEMKLGEAYADDE